MMNTKKREELLEKVIRKFGFEQKNTLYFAKLCENSNISDKSLENFCATLINPKYEIYQKIN